MEEVLSDSVRAFLFSSVADEIITCDGWVVVPAHVSPGAEPAAHTRQDDNPYIRVVVSGPHVLSNLGHRAVLLGIAH